MWKSARESRNRDAALKRALTAHLAECVKGVQFALDDVECAFALCVAVEAIFVHGLKDTLFSRAKSALADGRPEPSFWPLLLVLSHRDSVERISQQKLITTEVGQCRAWVRMALNDGLLSSYFAAASRHSSAAKPYYEKGAYVRDGELLDVAQRLIQGVESCATFELPVNSSLLNSWSEEALGLAGAWAPERKSAPIARGVDVASTLVDPEPETERDLFAPGALPTSTGIDRMLELAQDEALEYVLSTTPGNFVEGMTVPKPARRDETAADERKPDAPARPEIVDGEADRRDDEVEIEVEFDEPSFRADLASIGNSLAGKTAWSSDANEHRLESESIEDRIVFDDSFAKILDLRNVGSDLHKELKLTAERGDDPAPPSEPIRSSPTSQDDPLLEGLGFEVVSTNPSLNFDAEELQKMVSHVGTIPREYGLDSQDYHCVGCNDTLGTIASKSKVCAFTGQYFCTSCMDPNVFLIPARVIHNWDFHRYPVSKRAATFLLEFQHQPLIDFKKHNPLIYSGVAEMAKLQVLRIQLNFLRIYLFTCREPIVEELQKKVWPREYLYEHLHLYSLSDLAQIANGSLASQLHKIVQFGKNHVKDCWLCNQKGFICEICKTPKILYPFDTDGTYRCNSCCSVFHSKCLNSKKPCPKCERRKKRQGKSLVDAVHSNF